MPICIEAELAPGGAMLVMPHVRQSIIDGLRHDLDLQPLREVSETWSGAYARYYCGASQEGAVPYLRVDNAREFVTNSNDSDLNWFDPEANGYASKALVRQDDVVFGRTGTLGRASLIPGRMAGAGMSQHVSAARARGIDPGYLAAYLNSPVGKLVTLASAHGSTRLELSLDATRSMPIARLGKTEETEIGKLVRFGLAEHERSFELIRNAINLVEGGFTAVHAATTQGPRFFESELAVGNSWTPRFYEPSLIATERQFSERFELAPLGRVASVARGKGTRSADYATAGLPFVRTSNIINGGIEPFPAHYATEETYAAYRQPVHAGDILVSMEGKIGEVALLTNEDRCVLKNHIELVRPKTPEHAPMVALSLLGPLGQAAMRRLTVVQSTIPGLASRLREVPVIMRGRNAATQEALSQACALVQEAMAHRASGTRALRDAKHRLSQELGSRSSMDITSAASLLSTA